jgi:hypothetical protein
MKAKGYLKLYNIIFPIWLLWLFPITWLVVLPANFIIDSLVVLITLKILKVENIKAIYKKSILGVWCFGFVSDFIGTAFMFLSNLVDHQFDKLLPNERWWYDNISSAVSYNPFQSIYAVIWVTVAVLISSCCIYWFNYKVTFYKTELDDNIKKKVSLVLAIFTAPILFYLPTSWFY